MIRIELNNKYSIIQNGKPKLNFSFTGIKLFLLIIWLTSCQEPYNISEINISNKIPVVEGSISNEPGPYKVKLYWAKGYGQLASNPIKNASVILFDDAGNLEKLKEVSSGNYLTDVNGIQGTIGRSYHLEITIPEFGILQTIPAKLETPCVVDSFYGEAGTMEYLEKNINNDYFKRSLEGINLYIDIKEKEQNSIFFYFSTAIIWQHTRIYSPPGDMPYVIFYRSVSFPYDMPQIKATINQDEYQVIKKYKLLFIPYIIDLSSGIDSLNLSPYTHAGWVVSVYSYRISKEAYNYYYQANKQMQAGSQIFDPLPHDIIGNVGCISDSSKIVLGLFNVYSIAVKHKGFAYISNQKRVITEDVSDPGPLVSDTFHRKPPPYWVKFVN